MTCHEVVGQWWPTVVGQVLHLQLGFSFEQLTQNMPGGAHAVRAIGILTGVGLHEFDKFRQGPRRKGRRHDQDD